MIAGGRGGPAMAGGDKRSAHAAVGRPQVTAPGGSRDPIPSEARTAPRRSPLPGQSSPGLSRRERRLEPPTASDGLG